MRLFSKVVNCKYQIRSRKEGLKFAKPKATQRVGRSGIENVFAAVFRGRVVAWYTFTTWNGCTFLRALRVLRDNLVALFGNAIFNSPLIVVHDNDRSFCMQTCQKRIRSYGMQPMPLPVRSPYLMPLDYSIWVMILKEMAKTEPQTKESVPDYKVRLHVVAHALPDLTFVTARVKTQVELFVNSKGAITNANK